MKTFTYFESTEGGMEVHADIKSPHDLIFLRGWRSPICAIDDQHLADWMNNARVGEVYYHRLGCLVRTEDV